MKEKERPELSKTHPCLWAARKHGTSGRWEETQKHEDFGSQGKRASEMSVEVF